MSFHLDKTLVAWLCHITIWHTPGRLYLDLNFSGSLPYDVRWDCFSSRVFLSALWFGRPPLTISVTTISSSSHHRAGKRAVYFSWAFWTQAHVGIIYPLSPQCPICQLTDKAQMFLTCQFWCQQLCFICSQVPCRAKQSFRQSPNG